MSDVNDPLSAIKVPLGLTRLLGSQLPPDAMSALGGVGGVLQILSALTDDQLGDLQRALGASAGALNVAGAVAPGALGGSLPYIGTGLSIAGTAIDSNMSDDQKAVNAAIDAAGLAFAAYGGLAIAPVVKAVVNSAYRPSIPHNVREASEVAGAAGHAVNLADEIRWSRSPEEVWSAINRYAGAGITSNVGGLDELLADPSAYRATIPAGVTPGALDPAQHRVENAVTSSLNTLLQAGAGDQTATDELARRQAERESFLGTSHGWFDQASGIHSGTEVPEGFGTDVAPTMARYHAGPGGWRGDIAREWQNYYPVSGQLGEASNAIASSGLLSLYDPYLVDAATRRLMSPTQDAEGGLAYNRAPLDALSNTSFTDFDAMIRQIEEELGPDWQHRGIATPANMQVGAP